MRGQRPWMAPPSGGYSARATSAPKPAPPTGPGGASRPEPPALAATVERGRLPFVWLIRLDAWSGYWVAVGTRAHARAKARRVLTRVTSERESFRVTL